MNKRQVYQFIIESDERGVFDEFFDLQESRRQASVDALFEEIFLDAFIDEEVLNEDQFSQVLASKLADDYQLRNLLLEEFKLCAPNLNVGVVTESQVRDIL